LPHSGQCAPFIIGASLCEPSLGSAFGRAANRKKRFRGNICSVWPTHRSARDEELSELWAISKGFKYRPLKPMREVNGLSKVGMEEKLDTVARNVLGFDNLRQNCHGFYRTGDAESPLNDAERPR
jgi:hypothetical protein